MNKKSQQTRIIAMIRTYGGWVGICMLVLGMFVSVKFSQPVTSSNIQWEVPRQGICQVTLTVTNTSSTSIRAQFGIFVMNERLLAKGMRFYDELGHKSVKIV